MSNNDLDLEKTQFKNDKDLESYLLSLVLNFTSEVVDLEKKYFEKNNFQEFKEKYILLYNKYCTEKRKLKGSKINSIFSPSRFTGIANAFSEIKLIKKKCIEILFKIKKDPEFGFIFILKEENNLWRIDGFRYLGWIDGKL